MTFLSWLLGREPKPPKQSIREIETDLDNVRRFRVAGETGAVHAIKVPGLRCHGPLREGSPLIVRSIEARQVSRWAWDVEVVGALPEFHQVSVLGVSAGEAFADGVCD